jgi:hypothetical protein
MIAQISSFFIQFHPLSIKSDKNLLWDGLSVKEREWSVKRERKRIPPMITDSNQVRLAKMAGRRVQEGSIGARPWLVGL